MSNKLPRRALPTDTVTIDGVDVELRGLSRSEALHFMTAFTEDAMPGVDVEGRASAAEVYLLIKGAGVDEDEAKSFLDESDSPTGGLLVDTIFKLSGMPDGENDKDKDGKTPQASTSEPSSKERSTPSTSASRKLSVA